MTRWIIGLIFSLAWMLPTLPAAAVTDADIDAAVTRIKAWLYAQQDPETGSWDARGPTPVLPQHRLDRADYLRFVAQR